jgi:hypothetical protein
MSYDTSSFFKMSPRTRSRAKKVAIGRKKQQEQEQIRKDCTLRDEQTRKDLIIRKQKEEHETHVYLNTHGQQCPRCKIWIIKESGCCQMTCSYCYMIFDHYGDPIRRTRYRRDIEHLPMPTAPRRYVIKDGDVMCVIISFLLGLGIWCYFVTR